LHYLFAGARRAPALVNRPWKVNGHFGPCSTVNRRILYIELVTLSADLKVIVVHLCDDYTSSDARSKRNVLGVGQKLILCDFFCIIFVLLLLRKIELYFRDNYRAVYDDALT
jgi:hypothetical protein